MQYEHLSYYNTAVRTYWREAWMPSSRRVSVSPNSPRRTSCPLDQWLTVTNQIPASTDKTGMHTMIQLPRGCGTYILVTDYIHEAQLQQR